MLKIILYDNFVLPLFYKYEPMDIIFEDIEAECLRNTGKSKRYKKLSRNKTFMRDYYKVLGIIEALPNIESMAHHKSLNYEKLKYDLRGRSSVRIGYATKYRLIFTEEENKILITIIEISEHYGDK